MIIECINCNKVFEINSELIPENGRTIQCGSCNHVWFYNPKISDFKKEKNQDTEINDLKKTIVEEKVQKIFEGKDYSKLEDTKNYEITEYKPKKTLSFLKFLSYLIVLLISFIALLIIVDTFNTFLYQFFPGLELIMFNLFETLKDIELFIRDLI
tara:strand:- start:59 stop:523 length:465 start_codon:yes stop_codon:yes gene_type:complete